MGWFSKQDVDYLDEESRDELLEEIRELSREVHLLRGERESNEDVISLQDKIKGLKGQLTDLEIKRAQEKEDRDREVRETEHKVGLVRKEFDAEKKEHTKELDFAKKEARLKLREENLDQERKLFEKEMGFIKERFEEEQSQSRKLMEQILERLPNVTAHFEKSVGDKEDA